MTSDSLSYNTNPKVTEGNIDLTDGDIQLCLDYLLSHKMEYTQEFLREQDLPFSGTKIVLRERINGYIGNGRVVGEILIDLLNKIEGWGNQHIYLYKASSKSINPWLQEESVKKRLDDLGLVDLFNHKRPLILPEKPRLSSIEWTNERVRFVWVEKRQWEERLPEKDIVSGDIVWKAYQIKSSRGLTAFDWDLISGNAMLMIQSLPQGGDYSLIRTRFEKELDLIVGISNFEKVLVSRAIQHIERSGEVRPRQLAYSTRQGGMANFTHSSDGDMDPDLDRAESALGNDTAGILGNFYWLPVPNALEHEFHCKIYAIDQRVHIFGERQEMEVCFVLSRIRNHCKGTP
jgi:hypothetical protein